MNRDTLDRMIALVGSAGLMLCVATALCVAFLPLVSVAGASTAVPHEHLPHTSSALKDIASFTKTFDAPAPTPGRPSPPINAQRVRLANALPPSNPLSIPTILLAAALVLLGFFLHPFRKSRRKRTRRAPHEDPIDRLLNDRLNLPTPSDTGSSEELVLQIGNNQ